jgi:hypothetical protein
MSKPSKPNNIAASPGAETTFIARVIPWPKDGEPGYCNLHWTVPDKAGMRGRAYTNIEDFMGMARWGATKPGAVKDIYFCLSSQRTTGKVINGNATALRNGENVNRLKALWLDVDVKPGKGYPTTGAAIAALDQFIKDAKLPPISALVLSGTGGMHVYWISDRPLTKEEWQPYADGLESLTRKHGFRVDAGLATDCVRILRVPGTFNYKTTPPKRVRLAALADADLHFEQALGHIRLAPTAVTGPVTKPVNRCYDPAVFPARPMSSQGITDSLAAGIHAHDNAPLDYTGVFAGCPHFQQTFKAHGRESGQGLWMLDVLASTFLEDGRRIAHTLSKGYPTYTREESDAMYDRKLREREVRGIGWPSCMAFENAGCKSCATCPHKGKIKSPLNLALPRTSALVDRMEPVKEPTMLPVEAILILQKQGADIEKLLAAMNETFAVVRYRSEILVANIFDNDIIFMTEQDFHRMFATLNYFDPNATARNLQEMKVRLDRIGDDIKLMSFGDFEKMFSDLILVIKTPTKVSRRWFNWSGRRCYFGRGVAFEPGGPLEIKHDMLNLWRGFSIKEKQGAWPLLRSHILNVVCSGNQEHFNYLMRWMAYAVQRPSEPIGVAVAFRGAQGAGKGVVARTFGSLFGRHFAHIANGDQLVGRFNASLATSCAVFLDEALWAGDKKGEGVLKALITEPRLQLEAKFRDPIMVDNRLRIMVASNEDWIVPAGIGDRRWFILDVANSFAGTEHQQYWDSIYAEIDNGGKAAMFYDLLTMDLSGFNVRAVPPTAAKAQQQEHSLQGTDAWLHHVLQEGTIGVDHWQQTGLNVSTDRAYSCYEDYGKRQHHYRPDTKSVWSKKLRKALQHCLTDMRVAKGKDRDRSFKLVPLADCRLRFATYIGAPNIEWEPERGPDDVVDADYFTETLNLKGNSAHESHAVTPQPVILQSPSRAPDLFARAVSQAAADVALVRTKT